MSEIRIMADPSGKNSKDSKITIVILPARQSGKQHMIRNISQRPNIIMIDDVEETSNKQPDLEAFIKNHLKWIEYYFPQYNRSVAPNQIFVMPEKQKIKLGVKKRYIKSPRIQMLNTKQCLEFHLKLIDKFTKKVMKQNKHQKRPTTKAESIFDAEKRQREEAKLIAKTFIHTKPTIYLLK